MPTEIEQIEALPVHVNDNLDRQIFDRCDALLRDDTESDVNKIRALKKSDLTMDYTPNKEICVADIQEYLDEM